RLRTTSHGSMATSATCWWSPRARSRSAARCSSCRKARSSSRTARPPPRSVKLHLRAPGPRRFPATASRPGKCWSRCRTPRSAAGSELSRGGMQTKIEAGKIATQAGTHMVIASGRIPHPLRAIAEGARSTWFLTAANPVTARKKWIAGSLEPRGTLTIDAGAVSALRRGNSLLPVGIIKVEGAFARGDAVIVRGPDGHEIGRGLVAYDARDAERIRGKSSSDILLILGIEGRAEMLRRVALVPGQ